MEEAWLVLITITNTGLVPISDEDYSAPLAFAFPGRKVIDARAQPGSPIGTVAVMPVINVERGYRSGVRPAR